MIRAAHLRSMVNVLATALALLMSPLAQPQTGAPVASPGPATVQTPVSVEPKTEAPTTEASKTAAPTTEVPTVAAGSDETVRSGQAAKGSETAKGGRIGKGSQPAATGHDRIDLDASQITGNRELPKVLYIVPWKRPDLGDLLGKPVNSLLDEVLAPVDRDVFRRENRYFEALQPAGGPAAVPPAAAPATGGAPAPPAAKPEP